MAETGNWTREQTSFFISLYKNYPCLYDPHHLDYLNKIKKKQKMEEIVKEINLIRRNTTLNDIKMKIKTLFNQISRERSRFRNSKKSGSGFNHNNYKPKLWCYDQCAFLMKCSESIKGTSNINIEYSNSEEEPAIITESIEISEKQEPEDIEESNGISEKDEQETIADVNGIPVKAQISNIPLQRQAVEALGFAKHFVDQQSATLAKEEEFCRFLCSELKKIKIEENFEELKWDILSMVRQRQKKDVADMKELRRQNNHKIEAEKIKVEENGLSVTCDIPYPPGEVTSGRIPSRIEIIHFES